MKKRILVIEDNEQNLCLISSIMEKDGHEVFAARDGQEGIDMAVPCEYKGVGRK
jgi:two-component system, cell cycle response regulator DivK